MRSTAFIFLTLAELISAVYFNNSYPYSDGPLPTEWFFVSKKAEGAPLHSMIFTPTTPGDYSVFFFVPGLDGLLITEAYTNYLRRIASHGFITIGTDIFWPLEGTSKISKESIADKFMEQRQWMEANLNTYLALNSSGVTVNWNYAAIGSHSEGADAVVKMVGKNETIAKAIVFLEPFSMTLFEPTNVTLPVLIVGTALAEKKSGKFPPCVVPGLGYNHFWDMWSKPPKFMMNAINFGHCDILDSEVRLLCSTYHICLGGNVTTIARYQDFTQGVTTAFLNVWVFNYEQDLKYVMDSSYIPLQINQLKYVMK